MQQCTLPKQDELSSLCMIFTGGKTINGWHVSDKDQVNVSPSAIKTFICTQVHTLGHFTLLSLII